MQGAGLVPCDRDAGDESRALLLAVVERRVVGQHLQPRFEDYEERHLVGACADARSVGTVPAVGFGLHADHRPRGVVHGAHGVADVGEPCAVRGCAAAHLLHAPHALVCQYVGVAVLQPRGLEGPVERHDHAVSCRLLRHALVVVDHPLVAAVHEVDLHPLHAPLAEALEEVEMLLHGEPRQPEDDPHVALPAVADQLLEVDVRIGREGVAGILCPPLVHDDVGDSEVRREVDEIFVRRGVEPRHEVHIRPVWRRGVPELPAHLPGTYPRGVVEAAGAGEPRGHGVFDQVRVTVGDDEIPPREGPVARRLGDELRLAEDLHAAVSRLLGQERHLGEDALHSVFAASGQEHAGIILEPGLADEDLVPFPGVEQCGQHGQTVGGTPFVGCDLLVGLLVGGAETSGLLDDGRVVFGKPDREGLAEHLHGSLLGGEDAVCHAVVVGAELHGPPSAEVDPQGVVAVPDGGELERHDGPERPVFGRGTVA